MNTTVIVCTKNSSGGIRKCLEAIIGQNPKEVFLVDAYSTDGTREIAIDLGIEIIDGTRNGLTADRQLGINRSSNEYSFFIDSDHIIPDGYLGEMLQIVKKSGYDLVQSQLELANPQGILNHGEQIYYEIIHNNPSEIIIPGIAPAVFLTRKLKSGCSLEIEDGRTKTIEDTSWATKALKQGAKIGIEGPIVSQLHEAGSKAYFLKFNWYGVGDGEFCASNPNSAAKHYFHLFVRYPILYSIRAIQYRKPVAIPFLVMQGLVRGFFCTRTHLKSALKKKS